MDKPSLYCISGTSISREKTRKLFFLHSFIDIETVIFQLWNCDIRNVSMNCKEVRTFDWSGLITPLLTWTKQSRNVSILIIFSLMSLTYSGAVSLDMDITVWNIQHLPSQGSSSYIKEGPGQIKYCDWIRKLNLIIKLTKYI